MLRSIKHSYGNKLAALDGEIGHVRDFYFDDQNWVVRYVVADTGNWLPGRQVLLAPYVFDRFQLEEKFLAVDLTKKQIEDSPSIDTHKPLSRQYEMEYYRHYGFPNYWDGGGLWGMNSYPTLDRPPGPLADGQGMLHDAPRVAADAHLRSTQAVNGYAIHATDGVVGHVCDFMMEPRTWVIQQLVVKTGHRLSGREVLIPPSQVERISYDESTIYIRLNGAATEQSPEQTLNLNGTETGAVAPPIHGLTL